LVRNDFKSKAISADPEQMADQDLLMFAHGITAISHGVKDNSHITWSKG
jgi:hypothetical protein